jgi:hypothetical protein
MARRGPFILDSQDPFPEMVLQLVSGRTLILPYETGEGHSVVLFYRGHW